jgi:F0F1-type ATP synthase assembly protein I
MYLLIKFTLSAALVVAISEIARRSALIGALIASLPLVSLLAMIWLYHETGDTTRIASLSTGIFWLVLPSLVLFLLLPALLRAHWPFYPALGAACLGTAAAYGAMLWTLRLLGAQA